MYRVIASLGLCWTVNKYTNYRARECLLLKALCGQIVDPDSFITGGGKGKGGEGRGGRGEGVKGGGMKMLETEIFLVLWPIFFCKMGVGEQSPTLVLSQYT